MNINSIEDNGFEDRLENLTSLVFYRIYRNQTPAEPIFSQVWAQIKEMWRFTLNSVVNSPLYSNQDEIITISQHSDEEN